MSLSLLVIASRLGEGSRIYVSSYENGTESKATGCDLMFFLRAQIVSKSTMFSRLSHSPCHHGANLGASAGHLSMADLVDENFRSVEGGWSAKEHFEELNAMLQFCQANKECVDMLSKTLEYAAWKLAKDNLDNIGLWAWISNNLELFLVSSFV